MVAVLAQVRKSNDVTRLVVVATLVCDPYLDLVDRDARGYIRHARHRLFIVVAEIMAQEKMPVLVVTVPADVESRHLRTALAAHRLCLAVLLADQRLDLEFAELQIRLDSE